ncbi:baeRF2 domain-containing protein [Streptomyces daghestanicus]|uniref:baeRF2 domain-containing protein n=1 Tax=Streptomyces daghestanicus TaxID=66885 RepID=UPI001CFAE3E5|nr:hypothetical protein [Streptomyces daghestanicus]
MENTWESHTPRRSPTRSPCARRRPAPNLLILVGDGRECRAVHERMPARLKDRVVQAAHGTGSRLLDEEVRRLREEHVTARAQRDWTGSCPPAPRTARAGRRGGGRAGAGGGRAGAPYRRTAGHPGRAGHPPRGVDR